MGKSGSPGLFILSSTPTANCQRRGRGGGLTGDGRVPGSDSKRKKEPAWRARELIQKFGREEN